MPRENIFEDKYISQEDLSAIRTAANHHKEVRAYIKKIIQPGMKLYDISNMLEQKVRELVQPTPWGFKNDTKDILYKGHGFPTGLSINHIAAHFTPSQEDNNPTGKNDPPLILTEDDILKVDFGVHVNGRIVDSAFSLAFNSKFDPLIECTIDATNAGIAYAGTDVKLRYIGREISEVIKSYEYTEIDGGPTKQILPIENLCGHLMEPYKIHAGKSVPIVDNHDETRMCAGEFYAIETFASTGLGRVESQYETSHYMRKFECG